MCIPYYTQLFETSAQSFEHYTRNNYIIISLIIKFMIKFITKFLVNNTTANELINNVQANFKKISV